MSTYKIKLPESRGGARTLLLPRDFLKILVGLLRAIFMKIIMSGLMNLKQVILNMVKYGETLRMKFVLLQRKHMRDS